MKKYRVCVCIDGYVDQYVEAEDEDDAQDIALDNIDWDDVEFTVEECYEVEDETDSAG